MKVSPMVYGEFTDTDNEDNVQNWINNSSLEQS